jgi:O-antigen ligase
VLAIAFLVGATWRLLERVVSGTFDWGVPTLGPVLLLLSIATISLLDSSDVPLGARDIAKFSSAYCAYLVIMNARPNAHKLKLLLTLLVASAILPIAIGFFQFTHSIGSAGTFRGGLRIQATFDHANTYGFYLVSVLTAIWGLWNVVSSRVRVWVAVIAVASFVSVFLTLSRNTWAATALVILIVGWRRRRVLAAAALACGGVFLAMPRLVTAIVILFNPRSGGNNNGNSFIGRLELWKTGIESWRKDPVFGSGWGSTKFEISSLTHNDYIRALSEGGLIGLGAFLLSIGSLVGASIRAAVGRSDLPRAFLGLTLAYMLVGFASNNFGKGVFQFYFWVLAGVSYLWAQTVPEADSSEEQLERRRFPKSTCAHQSTSRVESS